MRKWNFLSETLEDWIEAGIHMLSLIELDLVHSVAGGGDRGCDPVRFMVQVAVTCTARFDPIAEC